MKILVYDTETTGLDPQKDYILELAWAIYEVDDLGGWHLARVKSDVLCWLGHPVNISPEIEALTGISANLIALHGNVPGVVLKDFWQDVISCDYVGGQNIIKFDSPFVNRAFSLTGKYFESIQDKNLFSKTHIDGWFDLPLKPGLVRRGLKYMALDHDYILMNAHRAVSNVLATAHIIGRYNIHSVLQRSTTPLVHCTIVPDWGDKVLRKAVYDAGFKWNTERKFYEKEMRGFDVGLLPFKPKVDSIMVIGGEEGAQACSSNSLTPEPLPVAEQVPLF